MSINSKWFADSLTRVPEQFERLNKNQWIQRRNVVMKTEPVESPAEGEPEEMVSYDCEARIISNAEYEELMNTLYTPAQDETVNLMANSDDNQTVLMEALAEIYEMLAALMPAEEEE